MTLLHCGIAFETRPVRLTDETRLAVLPSTRRDDGFRVPGALQLPEGDDPLAVPIPDDIAAIRRADRALSLQWRMYLWPCYSPCRGR